MKSVVEVLVDSVSKAKHDEVVKGLRQYLKAVRQEYDSKDPNKHVWVNVVVQSEK